MKILSLICVLLFSTVFSKNMCAQGINTTLVYCDTLQYFNDIMFNPDGSYYAVGYDTTNNFTAILAKFSATHNMDWVKKTGGSKTDYFTQIKRLHNGNLLLIGSTNSSDGDLSYGYPNTTEDVWVMVTDTNGNFIHGNVWGYGNSSDASTIAITSDDKIFLVGSTVANQGDFSGNTGPFLINQLWIALADSQLNKKWLKMYYSYFDSNPCYRGYVIHDTLCFPVSSQEFTGEYNFGSYLGGGSDQLFWNMDTSQNICCKIRKGGTGGESMTDMFLKDDNFITIASGVTKDGDYYNSSDIPSGYNGYYYSLSKMDRQGNMIWNHCYGPFGPVHSTNVNIQPGRIVLSNDNDEIWVTHAVSGNDNMWTGSSLGNKDTWILQFDSIGIIQRKARIGGTGSEYPNFIKCGPQNKIYIGVYAQNENSTPTNSFSCAVNPQRPSFKLLELSKWPEFLSETFDITGSIKVYPNPANHIIRIEWAEIENKIHGKCKLEIINAEGISIFNVASHSESKLEIDVTKYAKGIYYIILSSSSGKYSSSFMVN